MKKTTSTLVFASLFSLLATTAVAADDAQVQVPNFRRAHQIPVADTSVKVEQQGDISYITGGIGEDDRSEIEAMKGNFNLHVMSAAVDGAFVDDVDVSIANKAGETVLQTQAGPLLYVKLPAGRYTLVASNGTQQLHQKFSVSDKKPAHVHLGWKVPATTATTAPEAAAPKAAAPKAAAPTAAAPTAAAPTAAAKAK